MPTQRFRAKKWPSQEESARAGGVRGPWRRAPVETPAVGRCRQGVLQVAAVGKLFGCHIPGDTPCSHNCMLHSRCCMLQVAVVDRRFPGVTCMPQWRHVCPRRKCCEGTRCEPTALGLGTVYVGLSLADCLTDCGSCALGKRTLQPSLFGAQPNMMHGVSRTSTNEHGYCSRQCRSSWPWQPVSVVL